MKPHKHAEIIKAWADGAEIEQKPLKQTFRFWGNFDGIWSNNYEYRIKPESKPDEPQWWLVQKDFNYMRFSEHHESPPNLKLTFDGETGKLKSAEVLK